MGRQPFLFSLKYKRTSFFAFSLQLHDEIETSDGQDAKEEEEEEEEEEQNLIITFKRMQKFYPVFEVINKQPL